MTNIWSRAVEKQAEEEMEADPETASFMIRVRRELREGVHGELAPYVGQRDPRSGGWTFGETWAFLQVAHGLGTGAISAFTLPLGSRCHADCEWEANQAALDEGLAAYPEFTARVFRASPGNDCDGSLGWDDTVNFNCVPRKNGRRRKGAQLTDIGQAPLEIGSTMAATSWGHLARERCLARWPYGHDTIMVMFATPDFCNISQVL